MGDWKGWVDHLEESASQLKEAAYRIQVDAAEEIADILRKKLLAGVDPGLSEVTQALAPEGAHLPLSGLAKYVIVIKPKQNRDARGRWASGWIEPAFVTLKPEVQERAFHLENGYAYIPTPKQIRYVMRRLVEEGAYNPLPADNGGGGGVWVVPGRPFSHVLGGKKAKAALKRAADRHLAALSQQ